MTLVFVKPKGMNLSYESEVVPRVGEAVSLSERDNDGNESFGQYVVVSVLWDVRHITFPGRGHLAAYVYLEENKATLEVSKEEN